MRDASEMHLEPYVCYFQADGITRCLFIFRKMHFPILLEAVKKFADSLFGITVIVTHPIYTFMYKGSSEAHTEAKGIINAAAVYRLR